MKFTRRMKIVTVWITTVTALVVAITALMTQVLSMGDIFRLGEPKARMGDIRFADLEISNLAVEKFAGLEFTASPLNSVDSTFTLHIFYRGTKMADVHFSDLDAIDTAVGNCPHLRIHPLGVGIVESESVANARPRSTINVHAAVQTQCQF